MNSNTIPIIGKRYRHHKTGAVYEVLHIGKHTHDDRIVVIYSDKDQQVFTRCLDGFEGWLTPIRLPESDPSPHRYIPRFTEVKG